MNKAIFLARDGTLIFDRGYLDNSEGLELLPGVGEALARMQAAGFFLVVVTNQSGVGRGFFTESQVSVQHQRLRQLLADFGVELAAIEVCFHSPSEGCRCRKPSPEMLLRVAGRLSIDLSQSYMIGDKASDVEAGRQAGCRTILVGISDQAESSAADWQVEDLGQAARCILTDPHTVAVIPARYASTRFPGKALALIAGKPMIERVYAGVCESKLVKEIIVATDDLRIAEVVRGFGGEAVMTSPEHPTGSDRIVEAINGRVGDLIVNVQGDEPLLRGHYLDQLIRQVIINASDMGTIAVPFDRVDGSPENPNLVKVVVDGRGRALYFSRSLIPFHRSGGVSVVPLLHWGIYVYRRAVLESFVSWPQGVLERCEMLEQLRALENGVRIQVLLADQPTIGVDEPSDVARVERMLREQGGVS